MKISLFYDHLFHLFELISWDTKGRILLNVMSYNGSIIRYSIIRYSSNSDLMCSTEESHMVFSVGHSVKDTKQQQNGCMSICCLVSVG